VNLSYFQKKMKNNFFIELKKKIKPYFEKHGGHDFAHTERVYRNAIKISKGENIDLDVVKAAALLHDIAREMEDIGKIKCHAEEGAKIAKRILREINFPEEKIEKVVHAIKVHRHSKNKKAETKEAKIIQDADRLDALGAVCIARVFSYGAKKGRLIYDPKIKPKQKYEGDSETSINHFYEKIFKIKPETFKTKKARSMAEKRYKFVKNFVNQFIKEWEGRD